ncbi:hypothetical protein HH297_07100, partial [Xanthomonas sp. Kuri4-3]
IFTLGNLAIGGAQDGGGTLTARTGVVNNLSGSIEADGSLWIAANAINNQRRVLSTATGPLNAEQKAAANAAMPEELIEALGITYPRSAYYIRFPYTGKSAGVYRSYSVEQQEQLLAASAEGRIAAGGNIALSGNVTNNASTIAAAGALLINQRGVSGLSDALITGGENVLNQALALNRSVKQTDYKYTVTAVIDDCGTTQSGKRPICLYDTASNVLSSTTVNTSYIALNASMTGGQGVAISGAEIRNGAIGSDGRSIAGASLRNTQLDGLSRRGAQSAGGV